jgi:hypothetical protein
MCVSNIRRPIGSNAIQELVERSGYHRHIIRLVIPMPDSTPLRQQKSIASTIRGYWSYWLTRSQLGKITEGSMCDATQPVSVMDGHTDHAAGEREKPSKVCWQLESDRSFKCVDNVRHSGWVESGLLLPLAAGTRYGLSEFTESSY